MANNRHATGFFRSRASRSWAAWIRARAAEGLLRKHGIEHGFASLDEALAQGQFDAVTNVTPDAAHYATTMPVLAAGKP